MFRESIVFSCFGKVLFFRFTNHAYIGPPKPPFHALLARLNFMLSTPPAKLRSALLVFGIVLGLSGVWMLLPELLSPKATIFPFDRASAEAAARHRSRAVLAAEIGAIRGDQWARAAFTGGLS